MDRRQFFRTAAAPALAAQSWSRVWGANDRIRIASIGCGGQGTEHMRAMLGLKETANVEVAAVCDVFDPRAERAAALTGAKPGRDYRRVLDNKDIDAVVIAVPDHWHAPLTLAAAAAGKHVYCEKPMTHTIEEAQQVVAKGQTDRHQDAGGRAGHVGRFLRDRLPLRARRRTGQGGGGADRLLAQLQGRFLAQAGGCGGQAGRQPRLGHVPGPGAQAAFRPRALLPVDPLLGLLLRHPQRAAGAPHHAADQVAGPHLSGERQRARRQIPSSRKARPKSRTPTTP